VKGIVARLRDLLSAERSRGTEDAEELRTAFRARYHRFRLLLNANNKALSIMAEMGEALRGDRSFGMAFVQSRCTGVSTSVWQIIRNLDELASGKYHSLFDQFRSIQQSIAPLLEPDRAHLDGPLVVPLQAVGREMGTMVGGKLASLGEVRRRIGLEPPDGFAVTAAAYRRFLESNDLQTEIDRRILATEVGPESQLHALGEGLHELIVQAAMPEDLESAILEHCDLLREKHGPDVRVAVRSSALGEDQPGSFSAGQYETLLNVRLDGILSAYKEVVASKYCLQAMNYRLARGLRDDEVPMCVGCMPMVQAASGGVAYSRNPGDISDDAVTIYSAWGLPKSVVDGVSLPDIFTVSRAEPMAILERDIATKTQRTVCHDLEGTVDQGLPGEEGQHPSLSDDKVLELARLAVQSESYFGVAQDLEWAVDESQTVHLLQCRPLQPAERPTNAEQIPAGLTDARPLVCGGISANPGVASGRVFTIKEEADVQRFPEGAVLVTAQALPRWAILLGHAAAIVTAQGSVAGHLASVARESGVPALFGVREALGELSPGQQVTVDADRCCIYEGRVEPLLSAPEKPDNPMEGSPVHTVLKEAASHITPLYLLDPGAPSFKPGNCRTLHDITRYCHEYAVREMFLFGKEHTFPERSSKQLRCDVPMQWWVLNLDDGFKEEMGGPQVPLDTIVSIPMLSLWEGISAFPWEGPPPVDSKGFLSVMFGATRNTALVPGVRSRYADRNYFMISRNYCSLTSRLGFHFSTVEALVSQRMRQNYVNFQFKGGAADDLRRCMRTAFLAELLRDFGFWVEVKEDHLIARLEDHEMEYMKTRLKILGYLIIHTRQLDMIMSNGTLVSHYRSRLHREIEEMLEGDVRSSSTRPEACPADGTASPAPPETLPPPSV